jgi:F0F1-type ATP synthase assembly protein I
MKRIPLTRVSGNDPLVQGIDNALVVALLFGAGYGLDRWLGTAPWLMIVFALLGGVGVFAKMKYRYDAQMDRHEVERRELSARATEERVSR